jgi:hypothetical protein
MPTVVSTANVKTIEEILGFIYALLNSRDYSLQLHCSGSRSRFSTSSFRSCPIQLWIRGTIVLEAKNGHNY